MTAYRVQTRLTADGRLILEGLPFRAGDTVDVTVIDNLAVMPVDSANQPAPPATANNILAYMDSQAEQFSEAKTQLLPQYEGLYVLFENGTMLDSDADEEALVLRAFEETGPRPLFVRRVLAQEPILSVHGFTARSWTKKTL